jgi:xanthine dehydrogenase accessory factor
MLEWLSALRDRQKSGKSCILVTVAETRGSVPREAGAKMVVTEDAARGTIGGGQLEYEALRVAREMLAGGTATLQLRRFGLGPSLGQCCGGAAQVLFEPSRGATGHWVTALMEYVERGQPAVLVTAIGDPGGKLVVSGDAVVGAFSHSQPHAEAVQAARAMLEAAQAGVRLEEGADGGGLLFEPVRPDGWQVVVFGAGHVGKALIRVLGELPCRVAWIDGRAEQFPRDVPPNVTVECTEMPQYAVDRAPRGAAFLVMTHSHALDLSLCEKILARNDFAYFGLIGSATKRAKFTKRFRARGLPDDVIERMVCPIGIPALSGKHPGEIAVAVAAQLLLVRAKRGQGGVNVPDAGHAIAAPRH